MTITPPKPESGRHVARAMAALAAIVGSGGCDADPLTEILVVTDTDYATSETVGDPPYLVRLQWEIDASEIGSGVELREIDLRQRDDVTPPFVLPLIHKGGPLGPLVVTAVGALSSGTAVARSAQTSFVRNRSIVLALHVQRICETVACSPNSTCADGVCVPVRTAPQAFPDGSAPIDAGVSGLDEFGGGRRDAGPESDGGHVAAPDAAVPVNDSGSSRDAAAPPAAGRLDAGTHFDAGEPGAGLRDAGRPDTGRPDAGRPDAGRPDAGRPDAGRPDAGRPDAGQLDAATPDAGAPDAGPADAGGGSGDAGPIDAGSICPRQCGRRRCACDCDACSLECRDQNCERMECAGRACVVRIEESDDARLVCRQGASCSNVVAQESDNVRVVCRDPSTTCRVICDDVEECDVRCVGGASCTLTCRQSASCGFERCDGVEIDCLGGRCCVPAAPI